MVPVEAPPAHALVTVLLVGIRALATALDLAQTAA
jgi:hypothetical protein